MIAIVHKFGWIKNTYWFRVTSRLYDDVIIIRSRDFGETLEVFQELLDFVQQILTADSITN